MKVFLDGPRINSEWKDKLIPLLRCNYFSPTGEGWNIEDEYKEKEKCNVHLYVITPKMIGFHLIAQLLESANSSDVYNIPKYVVCCILTNDKDSTFSRQQIRSLNIVKNIFKQYNNCIVCNDLKETANLLNTLNN